MNDSNYDFRKAHSTVYIIHIVVSHDVIILCGGHIGGIGYANHA